jgi:hypothetical protein
MRRCDGSGGGRVGSLTPSANRVCPHSAASGAVESHPALPTLAMRALVALLAWLRATTAPSVAVDELATRLRTTVERMCATTRTSSVRTTPRIHGSAHPAAAARERRAAERRAAERRGPPRVPPADRRACHPADRLATRGRLAARGRLEPRRVRHPTHAARAPSAGGRRAEPSKHRVRSSEGIGSVDILRDGRGADHSGRYLGRGRQ